MSHANRNGFEISSKRKKLEFYTKTKEEADCWFRALKQIGIQIDLDSDFEFGKLIGKGNSGKVK